MGGGNLLLTAKTGAVTTNQTLGNVSANAGGNSILIDPNNSTGVNLTLGSLTVPVGSSLLIGKAVTANTGTVAITTTTNKDATGIYGGRTVFANGTANTGYDWATTASVSSPYTLSAYGSYAALALGGGTNSSNSLLSHSGASTITSTLSANLTTNTLKLENTATAGTQTLALGANFINLSGGGLLSTGTRAETISGNTGVTGLTANAGNSYELIVHQYNSGGLTIGAVIGNANGGANAVTFNKAGTGTLTLTGINTYTGGTTINAGTLLLGNATATIGTNTAANTLTLSGGTFDDNHALRTYNNNLVATAGTTSTLKVGGTGAALARFTGTLTGSGTLISNNTTGGNIRFNGNWSGFSGTLVSNSSNGTYLEANTSSSANATLQADANTQLGGAGTYSFGNLTGSSGIVLNSTTVLSVGALNLDSTYGGAISGAGGALTKVGTGTLSLTGASTHTGNTTVSRRHSRPG